MQLLTPTLNFISQRALDEFKNVINNLPAEIDLYIVGGSVRNAIYRELFGDLLPQRDYDQVATSSSVKYLQYLQTLQFHKGKIDRPTQKVYIKDLVKHPANDSYKDYLVFDIHTMDGTTIEENLRLSSGFTINGFALPARKALDKDWMDFIIQLPGALEDMKNRQLRVNMDGYKEQPANLFAGIRFISQGFKQPTQNEISILLRELKNTTPERYEKGITKVWNYVGGEARAKEIVKQLGIDFDIFDRNALLKNAK